MDGILDKVTLDEFKLFYGLDRDLYLMLVRDLCRNPLECLQIMGLWLWLERRGFCNIISKISSLAPSIINKFADEALACLRLINNKLSSSSGEAEIPLIQSILKTDISLQYFNENCRTVFHEIQTLVSNVYIPALSDIMERACHGGFGESNTSGSSGSQMQASPPPDDLLAQNLSSLKIEGADAASPSRGRARGNETSRYARTMFATFSKGYPVTETEVRQFFTMMFGNCIDSFHMQEVRPDEQPLYARIVFLNPSFIQIVLDGEIKAKFTINGKHVWMRQFVPRNGRMWPCGCLSVGPSTCPHHQ